MQNEKTISTTDMQDLITKFYYNDNHLCFQILVKNNNGETVPYMEFTNYNEYRKVFNELTDKKNNGEMINIQSTNKNLTNISFV